MKIILMLSMMAIGIPLVGQAQGPRLDTQMTDSTSNVLAVVKANRLGFSSQQHQWPIVPSGADTSKSSRRSRASQTALGAFTGTFGGAAIGATIGLIVDADADPDAMIPATPFFAAFGAVIGLVVGSLVGLLWPTG